jgi:CRISPR-associated endonuclease/helicase Cas3
MVLLSKRPPVTSSALSYQDCLAKTFITDEGRTVPGRSVFEHCLIVGNMAKALMATYPIRLQESLFPSGAELLAACHDIGKVSPTFLNKIRRPCHAPDLPLLKGFSPDIESNWGGHAGTGKVACLGMGTPPYIANIVGQHHGFSPQVKGRSAVEEQFGGPAWQNERERLVAALKQALHTDWPIIRSDAQAHMLAGLTTVADWIGSGEWFEDPSQDWRPLIERAMETAGFVSPVFLPDLSFEQVFGFSPRPTQQALIEQVGGPGVYILEAPMGLGKTEAALYAAYRVLNQQQANGIYFALPTQLTSNKLYERFERFLKKTLVNGESSRPRLLHSQAKWLEATVMGEEGAAGGSWFDHRKRGLLAPFAVGTLDQALMSVINVEHGFVRAFGLAGKVVILDEVHSYDAYTGALLDALIRSLRELHCTVIVLTATLDRLRRQKLLGNEAVCQRNEYPLITALTGCSLHESSLPEVGQPATQTVGLTFVADATLAVEEALRRAETGQQILWIENIVEEAQKRYLDMAARARELGVDCGLLHSRFIVDDRQRLEQDWVSRFGPDGWPARGEQGRILIGTQVLEQSLDIDADFLVSRFCPTDMLLQRLGRLWRHTDDPATGTRGTPRAVGARREAWIMAPDLQQAIGDEGKSFGLSAWVYSPYVLCRSLEIWQSRDRVELPDDIREVIEATYADRRESGHWQHMFDALIEGQGQRAGRRKLEQMARLALASENKTMGERDARTRFSEVETSETLLLRSIMSQENGMTRLVLLNGETLELPHHKHALSRAQWRRLGNRLMQQMVKLPIHLAPQPIPVHRLSKLGLQHCLYLGDRKSDTATLRIAQVNESDRLRDEDGLDTEGRYMLSYRRDIGYRAVKR